MQPQMLIVHTMSNDIDQGDGVSRAVPFCRMKPRKYILSIPFFINDFGYVSIKAMKSDIKDIRKFCIEQLTNGK